MEEKVISSKKVFEGHAVTLRIDTIDKDSGERITREIVEHSDCIAVVVIDDKDNVLLVRQYRRAVGKDMLVESPAKIPHRWSNESSSVFRVLVVKVPKPTEETRLL